MTLDRVPLFKLTLFRLRHLLRQRFHCPICLYRGPFRDHSAPTGIRLHSRCPSCNCLERHRLQDLVFRKVTANIELSTAAMLHVAPEGFFRTRFAQVFGRYVTCDLEREDVDFQCDLRSLPFATGSFDVVYASHVLEHIKEDRYAIAEIRRVLRPGGVAVLPVPIVAQRTMEYECPNPEESMHVRAPGPDYFERYQAHFDRVHVHASADYPGKHQLFIRMHSNGPTRVLSDFVPICYR